MKNYLPYNDRQNAMVVVNFLDQLQPGTFEWALHYLLSGKLDLSAFDALYKNDDVGRPAYDPAIMLRIILFAYSKGITSSRQIEWSCHTNIIFKALSCDTVPHFTTIAAFVSGHTDAIAALFENVLLVCDQQGLLGKELFAIDGCKMSSNAAKEWSGTFKELKRKRDRIRRQIRYCLSEHAKLDASDSEDREGVGRMTQMIETLDKACTKIDNFLASEEPRIGQAKTGKEIKSNITDNESGKMLTSKGTIQGYNGVASVDKKHQIVVDASAFGEGQEHHVLRPILKTIKERMRRLGISEDIYQDGAIVTADTGFANEANNRYLYDNDINAYIPDAQFRARDPRFAEQKEHYGKRHPKPAGSRQRGVIPASEFRIDTTNKTCVCPAGKALWLRDETVDKHGKRKLFFEGGITDCRACEFKHDCMRNPDSPNSRKGHGRQVSKTVLPTTGAQAWMRERVDSELGKQIYSHRMSVVEPVFGNIGTNKRLNRFSLRGKKKVQAQWQLYCMVHNIEKLMRYGDMAE